MENIIDFNFVADIPFCLVDDNHEELEKFQLLFSESSSNVYATSEPTEAENWIKQNSAGVLICDYDMPYTINGLKFLSSIKNNLNKNYQTLLLTGFVLSERDRNLCKYYNIPIFMKDDGYIVAYQNIILYLASKKFNNKALLPKHISELTKLGDKLQISEQIEKPNENILSAPKQTYDLNKESLKYYKEQYEATINKNNNLRKQVIELKKYIKNNSNVSYYKKISLIFFMFFSISFVLNDILNTDVFNNIILFLGIVISFTFFVICKLLLTKVKKTVLWEE